MKILSLVYEYPPIGGGGGVVAAALNATLATYGHEVTVVTSAMQGLPTMVRERGVTIHRTRCRRKHRHYTNTLELLTSLIPAYRKASEIIESSRPDLIHVHFAIPSGVIAYLLSRRYGIPYVLTAHGSDIPGYNPDRFSTQHFFFRPFWKRILQHAMAVTSPSYFLEDLIKKSSNVPVCVIPNGYTPEPRQGLQKRNMILVVARMFPRKGVQHFIESVRDLETEWEIVIAGDGPFLETLKQQASTAHCSIRFTGFLGKTELHSLYEQARILVFPSIRENFPIVLLEGMDTRCAVITTDAEGCAEVVGDAGVVVRKGDPTDIGRELRKLMQDPDRCTELAMRGWMRAKSLRWPTVATAYMELFSAITGLPASDIPVETAATGTFPALLHQ